MHWSLGKCDVFYRDIGDASAPADQTALLVHGYPESSFSFHKVVDRLAEQFSRLVLVDFPGFGLSDKPERLTYSLFEQADALLSAWRGIGVRGGHLISHDMGDTVATEIVSRSVQGLLPDWFDRGLQTLTLTDGNMVMEKAALIPIQKLLRNKMIGPVVNRFTTLKLFAKQIARSNGVPLDKLDIEHMWQLYSRQDGHKLAWKTIRYLDERDRFQNPRWLIALGQFEKPIHICWGEADVQAPVAVAHHLKDHICPTAQLTLMPGVGHFCQLQAPKQWSDAVVGFF